MAAQPLPSAPSTSRDFSNALNNRLWRFLDDHFANPTDLLKIPPLSAQLDRECRDLEDDLQTLIKDKLFSASCRWLSRSRKARQILDQVDGFVPSPLPAMARRMLEVDIPLLEKEVTRIETIRLYAEFSLQLESLVGDLEDAALATVSQASQDNILSSISGALTSTDKPWKQEKLLLAVKTMNFIENKLSNITNHNPQWTRLIMTVDSRVEKAIAILKPQALTDHRAILASLGWPPSLLSSKLEKDKSLEGLNPLLHMQGDKKEKYSQSFLTLCSFQQLLVLREARKSILLEYLRGHKSVDSTEFRYSCLGSGLWTINELVHPIASRIEHYFEKWSDQPKLIFALVYKITRDFVDAVDHVLQPLVDKARFLGSSVREAWVAAMLTILLGYLEREAFPALVRRYKLEDKFLEVDASWLDLVDLIITFDKRMRMIAISGMPYMESFVELERTCGSLSLFSIFEQHSDWLHIWAEIELEEANDKLKSELENEKSWLISTHQHVLSFEGFEGETDSFLLSNREEFKAPPITDCIVKTAWHMVQRAVLLPTMKLQNQFMRSSVVIFLNNFFLILVQRSSTGGLSDAIMEDDALLRFSGAINTARYLESVLREWSEDVRFMEVGYAESDSRNDDQHLLGSLFKAEIMYLVKLVTDFLEEVMSDTLLQFDTLCWDYIDYIKEWGEMKLENENAVDEENPCVSLMFVGALEMLKGRLHILRLSLNSIDFLDFWRSIADGLDHYIFSSIATSDAKLSYLGVNQFKHDMSALFLIFSAFCPRPQSFFLCTHEYLKLLTFDQKDATFMLHVREDDRKKEEFLRHRGFLHVSVNQAKMILRNRIARVESKGGI